MISLLGLDDGVTLISGISRWAQPNFQTLTFSILIRKEVTLEMLAPVSTGCVRPSVSPSCFLPFPPDAYGRSAPERTLKAESHTTTRYYHFVVM